MKSNDVPVAELRFPGNRIDTTVSGAESLVQGMVTKLDTAALSLHLFESTFFSCHQDNQAEDARRRELTCELWELPNTKQSESAAIELEAEVLAKREAWQQGKLPRTYQDRLPTHHAHSFLLGIDGTAKCLDTLAKKHGAPSGVRRAREDFYEFFPDLREVKNSVAHYEDRVQGLQYGQPIPTKPVVNYPMVHAPNGAMMIDCLSNDRFFTTMRDGEVGEISVNRISLRAATYAVQQVIVAFDWVGAPSHHPR